MMGLLQQPGGLPHGGVLAALGEKLIVGTRLRHTSAVQHQNLIGALYNGHGVGNHHHRLVRLEQMGPPA